MENENNSEVDEPKLPTILENYDSEDEMLRVAATNYISMYRDASAFNYLENLFLILTNEESSQHIKNIAIILSYKAFELMISTNQFCTKYQFIEDNDPGLLNKFLTVSFKLFSSFPIGSGYLFSSIFIIINDYDKNNVIIQTLCENVMKESDLNFIFGAFTGIEDICKLQLLPQQYYPILQMTIKYINSHDDDEYIKMIKKKSIKIIKRLIPTIDEAFTNKEIAIEILKSIKISISYPITKSIGYLCIGRIIANQFYFFTLNCEEILQLAYEDLNNAQKTMDEELIFSICCMLMKITTYIDDYDDAKVEEELNRTRINILECCFSSFFDSLLTVASMINSYDSDLSNDSNVSTLALKVISQYIETIPDYSFSFLLDFFEKHFFQDQNTQIPPKIFCNLISFIVTFCDFKKVHQFLLQYYNHINKDPSESFSTMIEQIVHPFLINSSPQVIDSALNLLQSIIQRSELLEMLDNSFVLYYIDGLFNFFTEGHSIAAHACCFLQDIIKLSNKLGTLSQIDFVSMFLKLTNFCGCTDDYFSCSIFDCIELIFDLLNVDQLQKIFEPLLEIVNKSFNDQIFNQNQPEILFMFRNYCIAAKNQSNTNKEQFSCEDLFSSSFDSIFGLFTNKFNESNNLELLYALTYLASVSPSRFEPHLMEFFNLIVEITKSFFMTHDKDIISNFVNFILFLDKYFILQIFIETLADLSFAIMEECISPQFNDISSFSNLLILYSFFIRKYFTEISEKVVPLIELFANVISKAENIYDDDLKSNFLISCSIILKNIFEKADHDTAIKLLPISFELTKQIICSLNGENTDDESLEEILFLFMQISNISPEPFQELSNTDCFKKFFFSILQNDELRSTAISFLSTIGISLNENPSTESES